MHPHHTLGWADFSIMIESIIRQKVAIATLCVLCGRGLTLSRLLSSMSYVLNGQNPKERREGGGRVGGSGDRKRCESVTEREVRYKSSKLRGKMATGKERRLEREKHIDYTVTDRRYCLRLICRRNPLALYVFSKLNLY